MHPIGRVNVDLREVITFTAIASIGFHLANRFWSDVEAVHFHPRVLLEIEADNAPLTS
jgi:hypothetical protein